MEKVKHFVLVHGICHGAWCWYKLVTFFKQSGHRVTAVDLGGCGVHPSRLDEIVTISDYVQPLMDLMASLPHDERVILVGHSYGGLPISLAMERFPEKISVAVFVAAYMPTFKDPPITLMQEFFKRTSIESLMDTKFTFDRGLESPPTSVISGPNYIATKVYQHCELEDIELAKSLLRPNGMFMEDMANESLLTEEKYGSVSRVYMVCEEDNVMDVEFQQWLVENSPPKEVKSIAQSGHMIMLSMPKELFLLLVVIANKYP